ncbi:hypothetical protein [Roseibium sp. RKSG952]|uniref:hypothetical protein n=1 Tax=Roseibium sp. RKSG952 TaxID=2529384 RepID=UPI0012BBAC69|nr:hypothetical protein [Roseibium sp. RKSG952]MTH96540.1 hypothetical protein [Roseibium sp. RKSG952]
MAGFYIADMRRNWRTNPYVTFWRPENAGYAYPLSWAGKYSRETVTDGGRYYTQREGKSLIRFAVPCDAAEAIAEPPTPGTIDGDAGPVIRNTAENRRRLRQAAFPSRGFQKRKT